MNDIETKIHNLELFDNIKTYLFVNLSTDIKDYNLEFFSNDNKLILNNNIENNTLSVNNIVTIEIQPLTQYFMKISYRKINDENTILSWHKFISYQLDDDIKMIIHKKNNNNNNFFDNKLDNFFFDNCEESENIDSEEINSDYSNESVNNLSFLSNYIHCDNNLETKNKPKNRFEIHPNSVPDTLCDEAEKGNIQFVPMNYQGKRIENNQQNCTLDDEESNNESDNDKYNNDICNNDICNNDVSNNESDDESDDKSNNESDNDECNNESDNDECNNESKENYVL